MMPKEYQDAAARTECNQVEARARFVGPTNRRHGVLALGATSELPVRLNHGAFGIAKEAGEIMALVERWLYYGQPLDGRAVFDELGDVLWYVALVANAMGFDLGDVMRGNVAKLRARYPEKYTDDLAAVRDRAAELVAMDAVSMGADASGFAELVCETCGKPATHLIHDTDEDFERDEAHTFCRDHVRPANVLRKKTKPECEHLWRDVRTPAGSGRKCFRCGAVEAG